MIDCEELNFGGFINEQVQFSSVAQSCPTLCNPTDCSTPGLPVHRQLPELTQPHGHRVSKAIQPSHSLSSPSPPTFSLSQHQGLSEWVSSSHQVAKVLEFQLQFQHVSASVLPMNIQDRFPLGLTGSPCSPRDSQESSPTPQFKSRNSSTLSFLYVPTLTSIQDYWKKHNLDETDLYQQRPFFLKICCHRLTQGVDHQRIDALELWCWRRLLRVLWTAERSNQSILKEINPEYSLEGLMLKLELQYFCHLMQRTDSLAKTLMLRKTEHGRRRGQQKIRWFCDRDIRKCDRGIKKAETLLSQ